MGQGEVGGTGGSGWDRGRWVGQGEVGGTGGGGWSDMQMVAVVTACRNALVGTGWSNSCLVCTETTALTL